MITATVSSKGQIVIPAQLRRKLGLKPGDTVTFSNYEEGAAVMRRRESWDEASARFNSWIEPGTTPLEDIHGYYGTRNPRLSK